MLPFPESECGLRIYHGTHTCIYTLRCIPTQHRPVVTSSLVGALPKSGIINSIYPSIYLSLYVTFCFRTRTLKDLRWRICSPMTQIKTHKLDPSFCNPSPPVLYKQYWRNICNCLLLPPATVQNVQQHLSFWCSWYRICIFRTGSVCTSNISDINPQIQFPVQTLKLAQY